MSSFEKDHFLFIYDLCAIGTFSFSSSSFFYCLMHFIKSSNNFLGFPHFLEPSEAARPEASRLLHCLIFFEHFPPKIWNSSDFCTLVKKLKIISPIFEENSDMLKVCIYFAYAGDREFTVQSVCKAFRKSKVIALFPSNESLKRYVSFVCIASSCPSLLLLLKLKLHLYVLSLMQWIYVLYCSSSF